MARSKSTRKSQDFSLNIVPVLDCFTILVTFMLASGTYLTIGALEVSVNQEQGETTGSTPPPPLSIDLFLEESGTLILKYAGDLNKTVRIPPKQGQSDVQGLSRQLAQAKEKWPRTNEVTLISRGEVPYQKVVQILDVTRRTHPQVALGGF